GRDLGDAALVAAAELLKQLDLGKLAVSPLHKLRDFGVDLGDAARILPALLLEECQRALEVLKALAEAVSVVLKLDGHAGEALFLDAAGFHRLLDTRDHLLAQFLNGPQELLTVRIAQLLEVDVDVAASG